MNISEKLGVSEYPWNWYISTDSPYYRILPHDINIDKREDANLIMAAPEVLESLIDILMMFQRIVPTNTKYIKEYQNEFLYQYETQIKSVEKATGKTWEEIRELYNA